MAEQSPLFVELANTYHARQLGVPYRDLVSEGIVSAGDLAVAQRAAGANMSVDVAKGVAYVLGDDDTDRQPCYRCYNDAIVNLAIAAADATKPRVDRIVAHVYDAQFAGAQNKWALEVLQGVATAGATDANLLGAAAIANNELELARVVVPAAAGSIVNANIVDHRSRSTIGAGRLLSQSPLTTYRKTTSKQVVNSTTETDLLNGEITLSALTASNVVRLTAWGDLINNTGASVAAPRFKAKLGATTLLDTNTLAAVITTSVNRFSWRICVEIENLGATNSQWATLDAKYVAGIAANGASVFTTGEGAYVLNLVAAGVGTAFALGVNATAADTSVANALALSVILGTANALHDVTLKGALVEVL